MKKRMLAILLTISLLLSVFNIGTVVFAATPNTDVTITVLDSNGNTITDATPTVKVTCTYKRYNSNRTQNITVKSFDPGVFGYNYSNQSNIQYYTINVTLTTDGRTYTASEQVVKDADSVVITLEDYIQEDKWETFKIYYIADGHFPISFYGAGAPEDYGPAGDDTPLLTINVNTTKLKTMPNVLYEQNVTNAYHFIPSQISNNTNAEEAYIENVEYANAFWTSVKECMDDESKKAFEATGLFKNFIAYCLKNQGSASNPNNHADGILVSIAEDDVIRPIDPPVYLIEMYDHDGKIFGGYTNDDKTIDSDPVTMDDILDAYNKHFNQEIEWAETTNGLWEGSYITEQNGRKYRYNLQIIETNASQATEFTSKAGIDYDKKTDTYYLAAFQSKTKSVEQVAYILTYTDGVEDLVFNDQVTSLEAGNPSVAFNGKTERENYIFLGWTLQGGDGTVLSQQEILDKYTSIKEDLTFVAVYMVAPSKYTGTVEVILDGYYDSTTATATGERIDITTVKGNNISLYVSADGNNFIPLERTATGVYSAQLENGTYNIYYYDGSDYILSSDQYLSINNDGRTRYIFFEYVKYELNGGVGGPESLLSYYDEGVTVNISNKAPTKEGYIFAGWQDENGKLYNSADVLSTSIGESYILTAQWVDAADVYINVTINHNSKDGLGYDIANVKDDITLDLVYAPNVNTPYLETGDRIVINNQNHPNHTYTYTPDEDDEEERLHTIYTAIAPSVSGVTRDFLYSVAVTKQEYDVTSVTTNIDANGDIIIDVVLQYAPENEDLQFEVKVDENVPAHLLPQAVIVKVLNWSVEDNRWEFISEHKNEDGVRKPGVRVDIDTATRMGTGYYPVWVNELLDDNTMRPYGYRIVITGVVYPDGSILETSGLSLENLEVNTTDLYTINYGDVTDGKAFGELNGAYFVNTVQNGKLDAVITATGYNVTFDAQGGTVNGYDKQTVADQYKVPTLNEYLPTRYGGYIFEGWYKDIEYTIPAVEGEYLNSDITLYAKWRNPLTIKGMITVGGTYEQENADGTVTIQKIPENEWVKSTIVLLQKVEPNGYTDTVDFKFVTLDYTKNEYYHEGRIVGYVDYLFTEIPDYGDNYRIQVLIPNYTSTFQNEDESINDYKNYPTYNHTDYTADFGEIDPSIAIVNVHAHFSPEEFELKYSVNAEQIGDGFRPQDVEILVTADGLNTGVVPSQWNVISQMIFDDKYIGDFVKLTNGKGEGSDYVWIRRADGITDYQYGIRVQTVVLADGTKLLFDENSPFTVEYKAPAYYMEGAQVGDLVATLVPKTYNVIYNTNGGTLNGDYPTEHTWSYETSIAGITPTFDGFKFDGWYLDKEFTISAGDYIDASVAADVNLYAKWIQVMDTVDLIVTVKHNQLNSDGLAGNYNKTLTAQLTYAERGLPFEEQIYIDMPGYVKHYDNALWHTHGNNVQVDVFEVPSFYTHLSEEYDYSANVTLEGYYVAEKTVTKSEPRPDGSILHTINITLQYDPEIFDMHFYVQMAGGVEEQAYPQSAEVKVTSWYDDPAIDTAWDWIRITQHKFTTITVNIDPETGYGEATYPVWHWYNEEEGIPYHYRLEVIQLNFADGSAVTMNETLADVSYSGGGYNAEVVVNGGTVPEVMNKNPIATELSGIYCKVDDGVHSQEGTVGAIIDVNKVVFHANNSEVQGGDAFRTYYPSTLANLGKDLYTLNENGTISQFYDIPEFDYNTHNKYVFKGWYLDKDSTDRPISWTDTYNGNTDIYAHWIETGTVAKDAADGKEAVGDSYAGFDLIGVQIREAEIDNGNHYGTARSGLRFITVLSEDLYSKINALSGNTAEYGFVLARSSTAIKNAGDDENYTLQLKGTNVNGVNTNSTHNYVQNFKCSGVDDHYAGEKYRLYTVVITYKNGNQEEYNQNFAARSYINYRDANGIDRTYYNNYTGTRFYGGCSTSFNTVSGLIN